MHEYTIDSMSVGYIIYEYTKTLLNTSAKSCIEIPEMYAVAVYVTAYQLLGVCSLCVLFKLCVHPHCVSTMNWHLLT